MKNTTTMNSPSTGNPHALLRISHLVVAGVIFAIGSLTAADCVWIADGSGRWSESQNWKDGVVPSSSADKVTLTNTVDGAIINNDIAGLTVKSVVYTGAKSYALTGEKLILTGSIEMKGTGGVQTNDVEIGLTGGLTIGFYGASKNVFTKKISPTNPGGNTSTINIRNTGDWHLGTITFDGDIDARWMTISTRNHRKTSYPITFNGKVNCYVMHGDAGWNGNCWGPVWFNNVVACETVTVEANQYYIYPGCTFDSRNSLAFNGYAEESESYTGFVDLQGNDLAVKNFYGDKYRASFIRSVNPATLTVNASQDNAFYNRIKGAISLVYSPTASEYTLDLTSDDSTRASTMSGTITVSAGTLKVSKNRTLKNVPSATVAAGATLAVDTAASPFSDAIVLKVANGGKVRLNDSLTMTVDNLFVGSTKIAAGTYTGDSTAGNYLPQLEGNGQLVVVGSEYPSVWTGNAGDGLWSSASNWENSVRPQDGSLVSLSGAGLSAVAGVMNADIPGISVETIKVNENTPFRLEGSVTLTSAMPLQLSPTCAFTNNAALALTAAACTISMENASTRFVNLGAISGASTSLTYDSTVSGASCAIGGSSTYTGDTIFTGIDTPTLLSPTALGNGKKVVVGRHISLAAGGDYAYDIEFTGGQNHMIKFDSPVVTTYNLNGNVDGTTVTSVQLCSPSGRNASTVNFNGDIDCTGKTLNIQLYQYMTVNYHGAIKAATVLGGADWASVQSWQNLCSDESDSLVGEWQPCYSTSMRVMRDNPFGTTAGALPRIYFNGYAETRTDTATGILDLRGREVTADRVDSASGHTSVGRIQSSDGHGRLILKGSADARTYALFVKNMDVVWDPVGDYTQTFKDRVSTMCGSLCVKAGTLAIAGSATFRNVTNVTIAAGAKFTMESADALNTAAVALEVTSGAEIRMPAGNYAFASVCRDGETLMGDITVAELPEIKSEGVTFSAPMIVSEATWAPQTPASTSLAVAENWLGGVTPQLANGSTLATFAMSGDRATTPDDGIYLNGLNFANVVSNFIISGTGTMALRDGGITLATGHVAKVEAPVELRINQSWNVEKGAGLSVSNLIAANGQTIEKVGLGTLSLCGEAGDIGEFVCKNGIVEVFAASNAFGTASSTPISIYERWGGDKKNEGGVDFRASTLIERPFKYYFSSQVGRCSVRVFGSAQVRFAESASFHPDGYCDGQIQIAAGAALVFEDELTTGYVDIYGVGEEKDPSRFVANGSTFHSYDNIVLHDRILVELNAPNMGLEKCFIFAPSGMTSDHKPSVRFGADYALDSAAAGFVAEDACAWGGVIDLNGHDQRVGRLEISDISTGVITSAVPAQLHVEVSDGATNRLSTPLFVGEAGLAKMGAGRIEVAADMRSSGALSVKAGTLAFAAGARWRKTSIDIASGAKLELANGVLLRASTLTIGGIACECGYWGSESCTDPRVPAEHKTPAIVGNGVLAVGEFGMIIVIR